MASPAAADRGDSALRGAVLAGLEQTIWAPPSGVSDFDRVEAVQLLGQFRDPAATAALVRVLREAPARSQPRPLGRWLRDTALDTLLRVPAQQGAATERALAAYYSFAARLGHGRLERNVIYDDIPVLVRLGRGPLLLRAYILPLLLVLVALVLLPELLDALLGGAGGLDLLLGAIFFLGLGLAVFNLHQVGLVLLIAAFGARWPLPAVPGRRRKAALGAVLAVLAACAALVGLLLILSLAAGIGAAGLGAAGLALGVLPLLVVPCYMLAHDLENEAADGAGAPPGWGVASVAVALRWASGCLYVVYVLAAYGLSYFSHAALSSGAVSDVDVLLGGLPYWLYLLVAPLPVLLLLAGLGRLQRAGRAGRRPQLPLPRGNP